MSEKFEPFEFEENEFREIEKAIVESGVEIEFSEQELIDLLSSKEFIKNLTVAGKETKKSGYETGFDIYFYPNKQLDFGHIVRGSLDSIHGYDQEPEIIKKGVERPKFTEKDSKKIDFHFHPDSDEPLCPSETDLIGLRGHATFRGQELIGICLYNKDNGIDMLLIRVKKGISSSEVGDNATHFHEELEGEYGDITNYKRKPELDQGIRDCLDKHGFSNCMISYVYNKKSKKHTLSAESQDGLKKFGGLKFNLFKQKENE